MENQIKKGLFLAIISTASYYVPVFMAGLKGFDVSKVPAEFYSYYCWTTSGSMFLIAVYAWYLFLICPISHYKIKIIFLWMLSAESLSFLIHVFDKFFRFQVFNRSEIMAACIGFLVCILWILSRIVRNRKSDEFEIDSAYLVKFQPKNIFGILNHLINLRGHVAIYQKGKIYKFKRKTKSLLEIDIGHAWIDNKLKNGEITLERIPIVPGINSLVGRKFDLMKFNCNSLEKYARKN